MNNNSHVHSIADEQYERFIRTNDTYFNEIIMRLMY